MAPVALTASCGPGWQAGAVTDDERHIPEPTLRYVTAMWADVVLVQLDRFVEALDAFDAGYLDSTFRRSRAAGGVDQSRADAAAEATAVLTERVWWQASAQQYFLLLALAQLRKCVRGLPGDDLPTLPDDRLLTLLRDVEEHWDIEPDKVWSLRKLRESQPDAGPMRLSFGGSRRYVGDIDVEDLRTWALDVAREVRLRAAGAGASLPEAGDEVPLPTDE
jgi:hypothetical protein